MTDTPRLLCYRRLAHWFPLLDPPIWIAIIKGTLAGGGEGVVLAAPEVYETTAGEQRLEFGDGFYFGATNGINQGCERSVWGLDSDQVPAHVAAAWMRLHHTGRLHA